MNELLYLCYYIQMKMNTILHYKMILKNTKLS